MVAVLTMPAKLATLGLLKIKVFWNTRYDVKIFVQDVTNKMLSSDSNHIVDGSCDQSSVTLSFLW